MKNEEKRIPVTRVTLSPPAPGGASRNKTVVKVSASQRPDGQPKRNSLFPSVAGNGGETKKPGGFSSAAKRDGETQDDLPQKSGDIWEAIDNRPKRSGGFSEAPGPQTDEYDASDYTASYKGAANDRPDPDIPFGSFIVELLFSVMLLAAVCALRTIIIDSGGGSISFSYPGNSLWAYMCISAAVFALLRIFFRAQYFVSMFVAFGTFFALNLNWLNDLARFLFSEGAAVIGGFAIYLILLSGFFFILWLLYNKGFRPRLFVKITGGALACLVLANAAVNWPL